MDLPEEQQNSPAKGDILIVDDTPANLRLLFDVLVEQGYRVRVASNGQLALRSARAMPPELILLDIAMPELSGYDVCAHLKADPQLKSVPIIFVSAMDQLDGVVRAFDLGGVDFISKPFRCEEVLARVNTHLSLNRLQRQLAATNAELQEVNRQLQLEIEMRIRMEADLERLATTDSLTGTLNRRQLYRVGEQELERARRYGHPFSVIMLDIDHFKTINDRYGHTLGDRVIQQSVEILQQSLRVVDLIGRYGGDEFIIILPETPLPQAEETAERLRAAVAGQPVDTGETPITVSLSMGVSGLTDAGRSRSVDFEILVLQADRALYQAKAAGRNRVAVSDG